MASRSTCSSLAAAAAALSATADMPCAAAMEMLHERARWRVRVGVRVVGRVRVGRSRVPRARLCLVCLKVA